MKEVAVFAAASESFSQKNINCSIAESIERFRPVLEAAKSDGIKVRGYVMKVQKTLTAKSYISCIFADPEKKPTDPAEVARVSKILYDLGCYEVSLGDTTGVGTPILTENVIAAVSQVVPIQNIAVHFHDTYGQAIANITTAVLVNSVLLLNLMPTRMEFLLSTPAWLAWADALTRLEQREMWLPKMSCTCSMVMSLKSSSDRSRFRSRNWRGFRQASSGRTIY